MKRVLLVLGLSGFTALFVGQFLQLNRTVMLAAVCLTAGVIGCLPPIARAHGRAYGAGLLAAGFALLLFIGKEVTGYLPTVSWDGQTVTMTATVTEIRRISGDTYSVEAVVSDGDLKAGTRLYVSVTEENRSVQVRDVLCGTVSLSSTEETDNRWLCFGTGKAGGVYLSAQPTTTDAMSVKPASETGAKTLFDYVSIARMGLKNTLTEAMPSEVGSLLSAICLGDKSGLSDTVVSDFRISGVSHLLVVSGLHVSAVAAAIFGLLRMLHISKRWSAVAALAALLLFGCLIGWRASVVRACVLGGTIWLGLCFRRPADSLNSLGGGLLLLWLCDPFCVYDIALWLSFGSTVGLIGLYPWLMRRIEKRVWLFRGPTVWVKFVRRVVQALCITLSATMPILPILACYFGEISLIAPLTNLLSVLPATVLLNLSMGMLLCRLLGFGWLADLLAWPVTGLSRYLTGVTAYLADFPYATWNTREIYWQVWLVGTLCLLWLSWQLFRGKGFRVMALVSAGTLCAVLLLNTVLLNDVTTVTAYSYSGQMAVTAEQEGKTVLFVSGRRFSWVAASRLLKQQGKRTVDSVVLTDGEETLPDTWQSFAEQIEATRYWLAEGNDRVATALSEAGQRVSVLSWMPSASVSLWENGQIRRDTGRQTVQLTTGNSLLVLCSSGPSETVTTPLELAMTTNQTETAESSVWTTRGQGVWIKTE